MSIPFVNWFGGFPRFMNAGDHGDGGRYTDLDAMIDNEGPFSKGLPVRVPDGRVRPGTREFCVRPESVTGHSGLYQGGEGYESDKKKEK